MSAVVVAGALASKPDNGGEAWVRLTWVLGLAELGLEVRLVESADVAPDSAAADWFERVTTWAGLAGRATLLDVHGTALHGPGRADLLALADDGAMLIDLSGTLEPELLQSFRHRAYVDLDPGWTQLWDAAGLLGDTLDRYDSHFTVGHAVSSCGLPQSGRRWHSVRPPVLLSAWPALAPRPGPLTTVGSLRGPSGTMEVAGRRLGGKVREWRTYADLPALVDQDVVAVVAAHPADGGDLERLRAGGWSLRDPADVAHPGDYRAFVQQSAGELSVAQEMYVATGCGWTSDRSAGYLASGRPVVVQDTATSAELVDSPAFWAFTTQAQAVTACRYLAAADPAEISTAARNLARRTFATDVVLPRVLDLGAES